MPNVALVFASGVSHPYLPDFFSAFRVDAVLRQVRGNWSCPTRAGVRDQSRPQA